MSAFVRSKEPLVPAFPKPKFEFRYTLDRELTALREHAKVRKLPSKGRNKLLVATWNIANLGVQKRRPNDYKLLAENCSWFDIVAVQEVNDNLTGLRALQEALPDHYRALFSEASGNQERQAFVYASRKVRQLRRWAGSRCRRASSRRSNRRARRCPSKDSIGPYLAAFEAGSFQFLLINVHLFFGSEDPEDMARRARETYAVAWWAASRQKSEHAFTKDIIPLGDFNLPALTPETRSCWRL